MSTIFSESELEQARILADAFLVDNNIGGSSSIVHLPDGSRTIAVPHVVKELGLVEKLVEYVTSNMAETMDRIHSSLSHIEQLVTKHRIVE